MLAFAKDITKNNPIHPEESKNSELKEYMEYQRSLDHERLIYHALDQAKSKLQSNMTEFENDQGKLESYLQKSFPISNRPLKNADKIIFMLRKLINGHNSSKNWYKLKIKHFENYEFIFNNSLFFPNLKRQKIKSILSNLYD